MRSLNRPLCFSLAGLLIIAQVSLAQVSTPVKWACIGNSITAGAYPGLLATKLGPSYTVQNAGVSGHTMLKSGRDATTDSIGQSSYWTGTHLQTVFAFKPDIITIALGTNDSKPENWQDSANFIRDYTAMIDTLSTMPSKPQIWLCIPCPCWANGTAPNSIRGPIIKNSIIPRILQIAKAKGLNTIDFYTPLASHPELFPDQIHPNASGADSLAAIIYRTYAAKCVKIACIGNSITQGANWGPTAYPAYLGMLLGRGYLVQNDGSSGMTLQKSTPNMGSYWGTSQFRAVFAFKPNVITIKLGTNDCRPLQWNTTKFIADYKALIDTLNTISPRPVIKMCLPIPSWQVNGVWPFAVTVASNGISNILIRDSCIPADRVIAAAKNVPIIDLNTPFQNGLGTLVPATDGVHPSPAGYDTIAHLIYRNFLVASMNLSPAALTFTAVTEQTDTTGTKKIDTVTNTGIAGNLSVISIAHKAAWLSCVLNSSVLNSQKITNTLVLASLPATPGTYYDTVTLTAANAVPASVKYVVTLNLAPGTGIAHTRPRSAPGVPEILLTNSGKLSIITRMTGRHTIAIMTASGRIAHLQSVQGPGTFIMNRPSLHAGVYIVRVASQEGKTYCRKIVDLIRK